MVSSSSSSSSSSLPKSSASSGGARTRRRGKKQRKMRGGYTSAASFQLQNVGNTNQQYDNVFVRGSQFGAAVQNLAGTQPSVVAGVFPSAENLSLIQSAGSRRRRRRGGSSSSSSSSSSGNPTDPDLQNGGKRRSRRSKRGGYWGDVISQALVPFSLLFAQNRYGTRKNRK